MRWQNQSFILSVALLLLFCMSAAAQGRGGGVAQTRHNLSVAGPGDPMSRICVFCHTPHNSVPSSPLWNRRLPNLIHIPYSSSTLQSTPGQPTHSSKLCLSCHDGTIAMGRVLRASVAPRMGGKIKGRANLTTDLSDDHPISFVYDASLAAKNTELVDPSILGRTEVKLDSHGQLQCTTCHDPHKADVPNFMVMDNEFSALCVTCHQMTGWSQSTHAKSTATWNGQASDPWPNTKWTTVASNACENCHSPHTADTPERLLNLETEEDNCLVCHSGNVAETNIDMELDKPFTHPVRQYLGVHDPTEEFDFMPRHVECQDCHNPHAATQGEAVAPSVNGRMRGVAGVSTSGTPVEEAALESEVCLKCHGDNPNVPPPFIARQILEPNIRLKFQISNPSMHPVEGPGRNPDVPSLLSPWTEASLVYCTDCHNSDTGPGAGGTGAAGPHGSNWPFLLEREYRIADNTMESFQAYELCYKCHDQQSILGDRSFTGHRKHVADESTPCSICHDPHGISATQGNATNNSHLINFDISVVAPDPATNRLEFIDLGSMRGECYLSCHGVAHSPESYDAMLAPAGGNEKSRLFRKSRPFRRSRPFRNPRPFRFRR